jgi:hypothetical protein
MGDCKIARKECGRLSIFKVMESRSPLAKYFSEILSMK